MSSLIRRLGALLSGDSRVMSKLKAGRVSKYSPRIAATIIKRIMDGESVASIVKDPSMPANSTLYKWLSKNHIFAERYAQALEFRTHLKAEERHQIIEDAITELGVQPEGFNANVWANLVKEKIRAVEWDAERLAPVKYKPGYVSDGTDGEAPALTINFATRDPVGKMKITTGEKD